MFYSIKNKITGRPYAVAINVPRNHCLSPKNLKGLRKNLSRNETYRQQLHNNYSNEFYKGTDIIAAYSEAINCKETEDCRSSSLSFLLNDPAHAPFTELLRRRVDDSCTVIFTTYCPDLNALGTYKVKDALDNWTKHTGIKAFVFEEANGNTFCNGCNETFSKYVPDVTLYHCMDETCCACKTGISFT